MVEQRHWSHESHGRGEDEIPLGARGLWRVPRSDSDLLETLQMLSMLQEEQVRAAAALLEREIWAATLLIDASKPIWSYLASPTLRFMPPRPADYHLELGYYPHLTALLDPNSDEQALTRTAMPSWARVYAHIDRRGAGFSGALACSYRAISVKDAVSELGFAKILSQLDAATRSARDVMAAQAREQRERQERLLQVERMLGWEPDPSQEAMERTLSLSTRLVVALLKEGSHNWLAVVTGMVGLLVLALCVPLGVPDALIAFLAAGSGALIWRRYSAP